MGAARAAGLRGHAGLRTVASRRAGRAGRARRQALPRFHAARLDRGPGDDRQQRSGARRAGRLGRACAPWPSRRGAALSSVPLSSWLAASAWMPRRSCSRSLPRLARPGAASALLRHVAPHRTELHRYRSPTRSPTPRPAPEDPPRARRLGPAWRPGRVRAARRACPRAPPAEARRPTGYGPGEDPAQESSTSPLASTAGLWSGSSRP